MLYLQADIPSKNTFIKDYDQTYLPERAGDRDSSNCVVQPIAPLQTSAIWKFLLFLEKEEPFSLDQTLAPFTEHQAPTLNVCTSNCLRKNAPKT